jgi:glutamine synthetase
MVKSIAEKHGLRATFMPKPFANLTGNGCHTHISVWDSLGKINLFKDTEEELGLSTLAYQFIGGVLEAAAALCAFSNPTVNSYKRLNSPATKSGATWSPNTITYSGNNRTHLIRIPDAGRFELRLPDGAANPYLLPAAIIAAGLDGIVRQIEPGDRADYNSYTTLPSYNIERLPANLLDALRCLEANPVFAKAFGDPVIDSYLKLQYQQWSDYSDRVTDWELERILDC